MTTPTNRSPAPADAGFEGDPMTSSLAWMRPKLAELCGLARFDLYWRPDEDVAQAVRCWEALLESGEYCCADIRKPICEGWEVVLRRVAHDEDHEKPFVCVGGNGSTKTLPEIICLAIAAALGWEPPKAGGGA